MRSAPMFYWRFRGTDGGTLGVVQLCGTAGPHVDGRVGAVFEPLPTICLRGIGLGRDRDQMARHRLSDYLGRAGRLFRLALASG